MNEPKPQQEPSMEEILASIRRIISEDGQEAHAAPDNEVEDDEVLELTDEIAALPEPEPEPAVEDDPPVLLEAEAEPDPEPLAEPAPAPDPEEEPIELEMVDSAPAEATPPLAELDSSLISKGAARASEQSLSDLAAAVSREREVFSLGVGNRTIEDLVKEVMRPMIKEWLDANLPELVERLVGREIDRMSRRAEDNR